MVSSNGDLINPKLRPTNMLVNSNKVQNNNQIVWQAVIFLVLSHAGACYGFYTFVFYCTWKTFFWTITLMILQAFALTAGAHRLWAHRSYKAKLPLRIVLMIFHSAAFQHPIYEWARDHRVHHKYTDTNADPHNSTRGFFFSHMGWIMVTKHNDVKEMGKRVDMSDLEEDSVVMLQRKYYAICVILFSFAIPALTPWWFWNEGWWVSWFTCTIFRYAFMLNWTLVINSFAHLWGTRPYDKSISAVDNTLVSYIAAGEVWHNYHHVFPWDYKAAELGNYEINLTTMFIEMFAALGLAYDLKTVNQDLIRRRAKRTGDGSKSFHFQVPNHKKAVWGWGDPDAKPEDLNCVEIHNKT